jgi:uncharacterized repeat protein (TIGR03803 family)
MMNLIGWKATCAVVLLCAATAFGAHAQTFKALANFEGTNGANPNFVSLVQGTDGALYGTTRYGGGEGGCTDGEVFGCGTVFKITRAGKLTTLYAFCANTGCTDGAEPRSALVLASDGTLYGTTSSGGGVNCYNGCGTVFKVTQRGVLTTLHSFNVTDGEIPFGALIQTTSRSFYGTTLDGGALGLGTVFKIAPDGTLTTLRNFDDASGGAPYDGLIQGTDENFYGTATEYGADGLGTVFKITAGGTLTTLHSFDGADGGNPVAGLIQGTDGNLYGTTDYGGARDAGTVFKITSGGQLTMLYSFCSQHNCTDGSNPSSPLIQATDGNFYGTTQLGGNIKCQAPFGCGTLFKITPDGALTTLHSFADTDGDSPEGGLVQATNGTLYGTTISGGDLSCSNPYGCGTVFSLNVHLSPFVAFVSNSGSVGQTSGILGQGFTGTTSVSLNGIQANFKVISDTFIRATVPPGATTGFVTVTTPTGTLTSNVPFRVLP